MISPNRDGPIFFVSDAHLGIRLEPFESREEHLVNFLTTIASQGSRLYIVGDLFDFWIEYRHAIRPHYFRILHVFKTLIDAGLEVHYLAGNHDFALGPFLTDTIGMRVYPGHVTEDLQGKRVHLFHGDGLAKADVGYRILRRILRNPTNQRLYKLIHPDIGVPFATLFSGSSRKFLALRSKERILNEYRQHAKGYLDSGDDIVIFGHTHTPELHRWSAKTYCNVGEWIRRYTFARLDNGVLTLWDYKPGSDPIEIQPSAAKPGASAS